MRIVIALVIARKKAIPVLNWPAFTAIVGMMSSAALRPIATSYMLSLALTSLRHRSAGTDNLVRVPFGRGGSLAGWQSKVE